MSPVTGKIVNFRSLEEVHLELCRSYDECVAKRIKEIGTTLYIEHFFFCNTNELLDKEAQMTINKYNFCKTFNCPPYPSMDQTPARIVEDFMNIDREITQSKGKDGGQ